MSIVHVPNILLTIPRNPVTALGLPLALGFLSGSPASKEANSKWYHVCLLSFCGSRLFTSFVRASLLLL